MRSSQVLGCYWDWCTCIHILPGHESRHNFPVLEHQINARKWCKAQESTNLPPLQTFVEIPLGSRGLQGMVSWLCASLLSCSPEHFQCFHLLLSKTSIAVLSTQLFQSTSPVAYHPSPFGPSQPRCFSPTLVQTCVAALAARPPPSLNSMASLCTQVSISALLVSVFLMLKKC